MTPALTDPHPTCLTNFCLSISLHTGLSIPQKQPCCQSTTTFPSHLSHMQPVLEIWHISCAAEGGSSSAIAQEKHTWALDDASSYRPTSNLPVHQSAYRPFHSTETAMLSVHNDLVRTVNNGQVSLLILLDLSAAFDTVDQKILLSVLSNRFSLSSTATNWFESYLTDETQLFYTWRQADIQFPSWLQRSAGVCLWYSRLHNIIYWGRRWPDGSMRCMVPHVCCRPGYIDLLPSRH